METELYNEYLWIYFLFLLIGAVFNELQIPTEDK